MTGLPSSVMSHHANRLGLRRRVQVLLRLAETMSIASQSTRAGIRAQRNRGLAQLVLNQCDRALRQVRRDVVPSWPTSWLPRQPPPSALWTRNAALARPELTCGVIIPARATMYASAASRSRLQMASQVARVQRCRRGAVVAKTRRSGADHRGFSDYGVQPTQQVGIRISRAAAG